LKRSSTLFVVGIVSVLALGGQGAIPGDVLNPSVVADRVVIGKIAHRLSLMNHGKPVRTYKVALGSQLNLPKERQGDGRTPEGLYIIDGRNASSAFHRALHISYPNVADRARATAGGFAPGGDIMIHGIRNGLGWIGSLHRIFDWTKGCIAVTDGEIEEIWNAVPNGTVVEIKP